MGWFGNRNRETSESDNPEDKSSTETSETSDTKESNDGKLDSNDRRNAFVNSLKVKPQESDGTEKLDTNNDSDDDGGERGNFEFGWDGGKDEWER